MVDFNKIIELHNDGYSYDKISEILNTSKSTVAYYCNEKKRIKRVEDAINSIKKKEEYEKIVCDIINKCTNLNQVCIMLDKRPTNTNYDRIKKIIEKYNLDISHFSHTKIKINNSNKLCYEDIFCENSKVKTNSHLKEKLISLKLKEEKCECCGIFEWNGKKAPLELHHINGIRTDNRLENLQLLCRNCHAQTSNFCGKNMKNKTIKKAICRHCGKEFDYNGKVFCSNECKTIYKEKKFNHPSKEELISKYVEFGSLVKIANIYNVSDKTISKWFKKYNLPYKSKELREYIINLYGKQPQWYSYMENRDYSKSIEKLGIKIDVFDDLNNFIGTFPSINKASEYTNIDKRAIKNCCNNKQLKNKKYYFKYHKN